ncbi:[protein-PII] uridylyltransferase family protein [Roseobacteraceae bacterium S113]
MTEFTRCPRPFDPAPGHEARDCVSGVGRDWAEIIEGTGGSSPYLKGLIASEADWLPEALNAPDKALDDVLAAARAGAPEDIATTLRQAKRRVALLTALMDLGGAWTLEQVTGALTDLGDLAFHEALKAALLPLLRRGKIPGKTEDDAEQGAGMVALAMGKMGAGELNYSSDIDLICLFDETQFDADDFHDARASLVRATRAACATLSDTKSGGYVFRTDLRLRPDPAVTPVVMAMEAAERYYESLGRTWERAAYIKARPAAGDLAAGARFLETLRPFIWRRHLDFAAIEDAHAMRLAIREHKGLGGPITLPGHNMKLGRGGIREIEFFTQTRQIISGGRDESLRVRGTVEGLDRLATQGWIARDMAHALSDHYRFHRTVEHRVQMVHDAQTHALPRSDDGFERLACLMDTDASALRDELHDRLQAVHSATEGFFAPDPGAAPAPPAAPEIAERWPTYPALRSPRGAEIFARIQPDILRRLSETAHPDAALNAFDGFLSGLPAGVQVFSLFEANPHLIDLIVDIVGTSPALARYLSRNAKVLDAVIGGTFWEPWPGVATLADDLAAALAREGDYEARLDGARRWAREWHFRIGVHHLRGLIDAAQAGAQYADLAQACLMGLWPVVGAQFALKHGAAPGRGAMVLGMGSLGAGRLTSTSDLDLIVIYDPEDADSSDGPRPLQARPYFARLTQALVTAVTAPMAEGRLYEVDMRLRPSGTQGPVATSWASFENYQRNEAWVWEHLALTRARAVAGSGLLAADVEALRQDLLGQRPKEEVLRDVARMRQRIGTAKAPDGPFDAKIGAGRMQDIELFAQAASLITGDPALDVAQGLKRAEETGLIAQAAPLLAAYDAQATLQMAARLLVGETLSERDLHGAALAFVLRELGAPADQTLEALTASLADLRRAADDVITAALPEDTP